MQRSFFQTYTPHFGPRLTKFNDGFSTGLTSTQTYYDGRGMPKRIDLIRTGNTTQQMAVQTRNVAGLVTKRRTDQLAATGTMPWVESNWVYDSLGRPLSQTVQNGAGASTVQVAKQQLAYYGTGDVKQLIHTLGASNTKTFNFEFDARHQLTRVKAGTAFDSTYTFGDPALAAVTPGNSGRFTKVRIAANTALPGSDVKPREVNYVYGTGGAAGVDKEAVTTLTNVAGGATFASYEYDSAGNQTSRTYTTGNERWDYVYDGEDNLRRVTKKVAGVVSGSEEYWYDESGGRMAIVYRNELGKKTGLRWFIGGTEAYYTASGVGENTATLSKVYSHPSLGTPVARVERTSDTVTKVEYQFHGLASNTLAAVASDGTVNTSFVYAPYGEVVEATDGGAGVGAGKNAHRRRITDKYVDEIGGLTYFGARYYDGVMLGWTQSDPLFRFNPDAAWVQPRHGNLYQYVLANPVRYVDPDGLRGCVVATGGCDIIESPKEPKPTSAASPSTPSPTSGTPTGQPQTGTPNVKGPQGGTLPPPQGGRTSSGSGNALSWIKKAASTVGNAIRSGVEQSANGAATFTGWVATGVIVVGAVVVGGGTPTVPAATFPLTDNAAGKVIGWGVGQAGAATATALTSSLTTAQVVVMQNAGLTLEHAQHLLKLYEDVIAEESYRSMPEQNSNLAPRRDLMRKIIELWPR